ncbi:hypothetical protein GKG38_05560 [Gordonibacter urolithinfaciens]|uniref:UspA domain-containing protein n=1 Tax=Gordonibacter urolithinfaciens TaxID=1335613 RepID=A0A7K0I8Z0_9ACTN|nr:hypothetical protein [Gordonibacter urolithinfaciens]
MPTRATTAMMARVNRMVARGRWSRRAACAREAMRGSCEEALSLGRSGRCTMKNHTMATSKATNATLLTRVAAEASRALPASFAPSNASSVATSTQAASSTTAMRRPILRTPPAPESPAADPSALSASSTAAAPPATRNSHFPFQNMNAASANATSAAVAAAKAAIVVPSIRNLAVLYRILGCLRLDYSAPADGEGSAADGFSGDCGHGRMRESSKVPDGLPVRAALDTGESGSAMGYGAILVAYDGSAPSNRALADALELVECGLGSRVVVLSVSDPLKMEDPAFVAAARAAGVLLSLGGDEKASLEALEEQVADRIAGHGGAVDLRVAFGKPQEAIVREAAQEPCGLIVMGSRGLGAIKGMLGSVSSAVLHASPVPVLITK